jgi:hypothetical protein
MQRRIFTGMSQDSNNQALTLFRNTNPRSRRSRNAINGQSPPRRTHRTQAYQSFEKKQWKNQTRSRIYRGPRVPRRVFLSSFHRDNSASRGRSDHAQTESTNAKLIHHSACPLSSPTTTPSRLVARRNGERGGIRDEDDDDADRLLGLPHAAAAPARGALHPLRHLRHRHPRRAPAGASRPEPRPRGPPAGVGPAPAAGARAEARRGVRDLLPVLAARAQGVHQRRQVHAPPAHDAVQLPRRLDHHAQRSVTPSPPLLLPPPPTKESNWMPAILGQPSCHYRILERLHVALTRLFARVEILRSRGIEQRLCIPCIYPF